MSQTSSTDQTRALRDLLAEIEALDKAHSSIRRSRKVAHRLKPFIDFVERYSPAVDVGVQGVPSPAIVIWGCLRAIIVVSPLA